MASRPYVVRHSWVTRLRDSELLSFIFKFVAKPGGTFANVSKKLLELPVYPEADYVLIILGGNDCYSAWDTNEVGNLKLATLMQQYYGCKKAGYL